MRAIGVMMVKHQPARVNAILLGSSRRCAGRPRRTRRGGARVIAAMVSQGSTRPPRPRGTGAVGGPPSTSAATDPACVPRSAALPFSGGLPRQISPQASCTCGAHRRWQARSPRCRGVRLRAGTTTNQYLRRRFAVEAVPPFGPGFLPATTEEERQRDRVVLEQAVGAWDEALPALNAAAPSRGCRRSPTCSTKGAARPGY